MEEAASDTGMEPASSSSSCSGDANVAADESRAQPSSSRSHAIAAVDSSAERSQPPPPSHSAGAAARSDEFSSDANHGVNRAEEESDVQLDGQCGMQRLATVELQSVMHFLDRSSLLALARSCCRLHAAADSAFAWRHVPPVPLPLRELSAAWSSRFSASLVRHGGLALQWIGRHDSSDADAELAHMQQLLPFDACKQLTISDAEAPLQLSHLERLCRMPQLSSVTELHFLSNQPPLGFIHSLQHLSSLRRLKLEFCYLAEFEALDGLALLPRLDRLELSDVVCDDEVALRHATTASRLYDSIGQCRSLTHLRLHQLLLDDPSLHRLLRSPSVAATLQRLELVFAQVSDGAKCLSPGSLAALQAAFGGLTRLRHLAFRGAFVQLDPLLLHIVHALPLATLELNFVGRQSHLSPAALQRLLQSAPVTHITYGLDYPSPHTRREYEAPLSAEERARLTLA